MDLTRITQRKNAGGVSGIVETGNAACVYLEKMKIHLAFSSDFSFHPAGNLGCAGCRRI